MHVTTNQGPMPVISSNAMPVSRSEWQEAEAAISQAATLQLATLQAASFEPDTLEAPTHTHTHTHHSQHPRAQQKDWQQARYNMQQMHQVSMQEPTMQTEAIIQTEARRQTEDSRQTLRCSRQTLRCSRQTLQGIPYPRDHTQQTICRVQGIPYVVYKAYHIQETSVLQCVVVCDTRHTISNRLVCCSVL